MKEALWRLNQLRLSKDLSPSLSECAPSVHLNGNMQAVDEPARLFKDFSPSLSECAPSVHLNGNMQAVDKPARLLVDV